MKFPLFFFGVAVLTFGGCADSPEVATATTAIPTAIPTSTSTSISTPVAAPAPTAKVTVVRSNRPSLPTLPQMMGNEPRPTFIPRPTPKVRPGETIIVSNARPTPTPRENPTIIVSNAPIAGTEISAPAAAARELVWVNAKSRIFHRPGSRFYGGTVEGFYTTEAQARARGYRASLR